MRLFGEDLELVFFVAGVLAANGLAIALWMLLVQGRSHGVRRCPGCWYSMDGAAPDDQGRFRCPECGRRIRNGRGLHRTRRHWRRALPGIALFLLGTSLATLAVFRHTNPWRLAPTIVVIDAIPRMRASGPLINEFHRRTFLERPAFAYSHRFGGPLPLDLSSYQLREMRGFERLLLVRRACETLEANPNHPLALELMIVLGISGEERERAFGVVQKVLMGSSDRSDVAIAALCLVAPNEEKAAEAIGAKLRSLMAADPSLQDFISRWTALAAVSALGELGPAAKAAVPELISMLPVAESSAFGVRIPVLETLGRIGPSAAEALPFLEADADLTRPRSGDRIDAAAAKLLIDGTCANMEEAFAHLLGHTNWRARRAAAMHLGELPIIGDVGKGALRRAMDDGHEIVCESAQHAARKHGVERIPAR